MCGFSGIVFSSETPRNTRSHGIEGFRRAADRVAHRGDTEHRELLLERIWLSHYRLAFQDVASGAQPMLSGDGLHVIVFNGEVYNHLGLRTEVTRQTGVSFRTRSDTETILEGWKAYGPAFFDRLEGEYAFVILSVDGLELTAHRDRFGVKPLFVFCDGLDTGTFASFSERYSFDCTRIEFSSEVKGLCSPKGWNRQGLLRQFVGLYEPIRTPFNHVIQVPPGGVLFAHARQGRLACELTTFPDPIRTSVAGQADNAEQHFAELLHNSVSERLLSDVELGVYLSGGVDSKVVAHELSGLLAGDRPMKSFTVGFSQSGYDETKEALRFAKHAGFKPHVVNIDNDALNYSYPLAVQNSELVQPFTNGAAKWWLSLFTRRYVSGVLTGDGADELLCGYPSYRYANWWKFVIRGRGEAQTVKDTLRLLKHSPLGTLGRDRLYLARFSAHTDNPWLAGSSAAGTGQDFMDSLQMLGVPHPLFGQIRAITASILGQNQGDQWLCEQASSVQSWYYAGLESLSSERESPRNALLLWQNYFAKTHLPTLILNWVGDRMEMANTLEGRTPFLSNQLRQYLATMPDRLMVSGLRDKVLLRRAYASRLTKDFAATPKKQFNAPFLDSARLAGDFGADNILMDTGLNDELPLHRLQSAAQKAGRDDPYLATHLRSAYQTALAASVVNATIVQRKALERNDALERAYLDKGGPVH
jgi:asparagine synthase (glutamine-hydrolysing)